MTSLEFKKNAHVGCDYSFYLPGLSIKPHIPSQSRKYQCCPVEFSGQGPYRQLALFGTPPGFSEWEVHFIRWALEPWFPDPG